MSATNDTRPFVLRLTQEQLAARAPLVEAGNRILSLLYRCSDQATDEQRREHYRQHSSLCRIWNDALVEPIQSVAPPAAIEPPEVAALVREAELRFAERVTGALSAMVDVANRSASWDAGSRETARRCAQFLRGTLSLDDLRAELARRRGEGPK